MSLTPIERARLIAEAERLRHEFWSLSGTGPEVTEKKRALRARYVKINQFLAADDTHSPTLSSRRIHGVRLRATRLAWGFLILILFVGVTSVIVGEAGRQDYAYQDLPPLRTERVASVGTRLEEDLRDGDVYAGMLPAALMNSHSGQTTLWDKADSYRAADPENREWSRKPWFKNTVEFPGKVIIGETGDGGAFQSQFDNEHLMQKVTELQAEVRSLRKTSDLTVSYIVGELEKENRWLREQIVATTGAGLEEYSDDGRDLDLTSTHASALSQGFGEKSADSTVPAASGEVDYVVIEQWGRLPEDVIDLAADVPSLLGMVCSVAPSLSAVELSQFGCYLRQKFDVYDNIVIDVFNDESAARAFAKGNVESPDHHVLSIQKELNSRQDRVLLHELGQSVDVSCSS